MTSGMIVFAILALVAVGAAVSMILTRNAVYSALFLVLNFFTIAIIYFILGAPFIALAQIAVYAGAIMVLFLFVIMLLGAEKAHTEEPLRGQRWMGLLVGAIFLAEVVVFVILRGATTAAPLTITMDASPQAIGMELFNQYFLPFEITSIILLVALVGAIVLTRNTIISKRL